MASSCDKIAPLIHGALSITFVDGYLEASRFTKEQFDYLKGANEKWWSRAHYSASITLEFITDADFFSFDYVLPMVASRDSIDVYVSDKHYRSVRIKEIDTSGTIAFNLPHGEKAVTVYFPIDSQMVIKDLYINGNYYAVPHKKQYVLWMGDSITQGYGPKISGETYVNIANRILGYEILNQGIGGWEYDKNAVPELMDFKPEKIITAFGTNNYKSTDFEKNANEFFEKLDEVFNCVPALVITPLWRTDLGDNEALFRERASFVIELCEKYKNIKVLEGFDLIPHNNEYFLDHVHPNALGAEHFALKLVEYINKYEF